MAGVEVVLNKPVRQSQLYDALATMLGTPAETHRQTVARKSQARSARGPGGRSTGVRGHVLLAEDYPVNRMVAISDAREVRLPGGRRGQREARP